MRKFYTLITTIIISSSVFSQAPEKMSYQAVVRDGSNTLVASSSIGMQISILQGSSSGIPVYVEMQTATSNANGLVSIEIGGGSVVSGSFITIDWANGPYFVKTETDPTGGTNYTITGTSQLLSVPYALYAKTAENVVEPTYSIGLYPEVGGYVFWVSADGKHGLVAETIDQAVSSNWYDALFNVSSSSNHSANGQQFRDWRLPSKIELDEMYQQQAAIGGYSTGIYWSATESNFDSAFGVDFSSGGQPNSFKTTTYFVRSIRSF